MTRYTVSQCVAVMILALCSTASPAWAPEAPFPRFPDGVGKLPADIVKGAPFDTRFFDAPPFDKNAAPLYLDALFDFSSEPASCFAAGPERERRRETARHRGAQFNRVYLLLQKDRNAVPRGEIAKVVGEYDEGFRKLALAQKRNRCVFETGIGLSSGLPHVQSARSAARVATLRVRLQLGRGDFDAAIGDVKTILRLARDIQPRGYIITQLVSTAIVDIACKDMIAPILAAPGLRIEHCDTVLALLAGHKAESIDMYTEALRVEYLSKRFTILDLVKHQEKFAREMDLAPGSVIKGVIESSGAMTLAASAPAGALKPEPPKPEPVPADADARVARMTPAEIDKVVGRLNKYFRVLLDLKDRPRYERSEVIPDVGAFLLDDDLLSRSLRALNPAVGAFAKSFGRAEADRAGAECLAAARRWQLSHDGILPPNLATAFQDLKLAVPTDPFDGKPMRMFIRDGRPVVYSIGKDGEDDLGRVDSDNDQLTGDLLYELPAP